MMRKFKTASDIKVGVVGYGGAFNMGKHHLDAMAREGMIPTAVAELADDRLAIARQDFAGIETYTSVAAMLKKSSVNLVVIVTPHHTHAKLAMQSLRAGRHVVCEKPMAVTTAECDRMIAAAKKQRVLVTTYHNRHWDGCILQAVKAIRRGAIGKVYRVRSQMGSFSAPGNWWRSSKSISGGILYDWGVHFLEYALQIIDSDIVEVAGFAHQGLWADKTVWKQDTIEDEASAVVRFASGAWLTLTITHMDANPSPCWMEIVGTRGAYSFNHEHWTTTKISAGRTVTTQGANPPHQWHQFYRNIVRHLVGNEPLVITPQWARRPIHILDLADRSAAGNKSMRARYK